MTMSDPILRRIYDLDVQEFDVSVRAIIALSEDAAAGIAALDFLSEEVMRDLVEHDSSDVRGTLARNHSCPPRLLAHLVADPDEWVRYHAVRNPGASEEVKAAFALASSPSEVARAKHRSEDVSPKDNPEFERLVETARGRREWQSLWGRGDWIWPSTYPFLTEGAPDWLVALLSRHGHPAALLHRDMAPRPSPVEPAGALRDLVNCELLVRALWRELALAGVVSLVYWNDRHEGDKFFPQADGLELIDSDSAAQFIIGGYSSSREWITTSDSLWEHAVLRLAAGGFEYWFDYQMDEEFDDASLGLFALSGVAWISERNHAPIELTPAGQEAVDGPLFDAMTEQAEPDDYDTEVTVGASRLPAIGYAETSEEQKAWLTDLIRQSRQDFMVKTWGIADHFLMCIALHPATPQSIRDQLLMDSSSSVREAARIAMSTQSQA
jgi:hypothetical protein